MEIDPLDSVETEDTAAASHSRLNSRVAITVALLATFLGVCKVKDDNIVQGMQQAQADKIDHWSFYQARNIRQEVAQSTVTTLTVQRRVAAPADRAGPRGRLAAPRLLFKLPTAIATPAQLSSVASSDGEQFVFALNIPPGAGSR